MSEEREAAGGFLHLSLSLSPPRSGAELLRRRHGEKLEALQWCVKAGVAPFDPERLAFNLLLCPAVCEEVTEGGGDS